MTPAWVSTGVPRRPAWSQGPLPSLHPKVSHLLSGYACTAPCLQGPVAGCSRAGWDPHGWHLTNLSPSRPLPVAVVPLEGEKRWQAGVRRDLRNDFTLLDRGRHLPLDPKMLICQVAALAGGVGALLAPRGLLAPRRARRQTSPSWRASGWCRSPPAAGTGWRDPAFRPGLPGSGTAVRGVPRF